MKNKYYAMQRQWKRNNKMRKFYKMKLHNRTNETISDRKYETQSKIEKRLESVNRNQTKKKKQKLLIA